MQPTQAPPIPAHLIGTEQYRLEGWRDQLLDHLDKAKPLADQVYGAGSAAASAFRNAAEDYRILREGRQNYLSLTEGEQQRFDGMQAGYQPVYGTLSAHVERLRHSIDPEHLAAAHRSTYNELATQRNFLNALPMYENSLFQSRMAVAAEVASEQNAAGIRAANQRLDFEATQGQSVAIALQKTRDRSAYVSTDEPDPATGSAYNERQQLKLQTAQDVVMLRKFHHGFCGDILGDATERFNIKLYEPNGGRGDRIAEIDLKETDFNAPEMNHVLLRIGPRNEPESLVYCNWTQQATMANYQNLTVAHLHKYDEATSRVADGRDWVAVARRYIDTPKLDMIEQLPLTPHNHSPREIYNVSHGTLRQAGGNELSPYGMSATLASDYQPDPAYLRYASTTARPPGPAHLAGFMPGYGAGPSQADPPHPATQFARNWQNNGSQYAPKPDRSPRDAGSRATGSPPLTRSPGGTSGHGL